MLKLVLDCPPDAAWRAIRSPEVFRAVSFPLVSFVSLEPDGFPESWPPGEHPVQATALGVIAAGDQLIDIAVPERADDVRMVVDSGRALTGALTVVTQFQHTMAVSPAPGGKTLFRDRLEFSAGAATLPVWLFYWSFWQWRAIRIKMLSPRWR